MHGSSSGAPAQAGYCPSLKKVGVPLVYPPKKQNKTKTKKQKTNQKTNKNNNNKTKNKQNKTETWKNGAFSCRPTKWSKLMTL